MHPITKAANLYGVSELALENRVPLPSNVSQKQPAANVAGQVKALVATVIASFAMTKPPLVMGRMLM